MQAGSRSWIKRKTGACNGFTLVELLVVIAIIGILVALLLPSVQSAREAARRTQCVNKLKQIGLALNNYNSAHSYYPYGADDADCETVDGGSRPRKPLTWRVLILPYLEEQAVYDQLTVLAEQSVVTGCYPVRPWENSPLQQQEMSSFVCPSEQGGGIHDGFSSWSGPATAAISSYFWECRTSFHGTTGLGFVQRLWQVHGRDRS